MAVPFYGNPERHIWWANFLGRIIWWALNDAIENWACELYAYVYVVTSAPISIKCLLLSNWAGTLKFCGTNNPLNFDPKKKKTIL